MRPLGIALSLALVLAQIACSSGPSEIDIVRSVTGALVPQLDSAADEAEGLAAAGTVFCQTPTADSHSRAQEAWLEAKDAWERAELSTYFGPADMLRTLSKVDYAPISETGIDDLLASDVAIGADYIDNQAASTQRGLGAIEYALFRDLEDASDPRICRLTVSAAEIVAEETRALHDAWADSFDGGPAFAQIFTGTMTTDQALGDVVGAIVETLKRQSLFELGQALGISAPEPDIEAIPEGAAGEAAMMYLAQLEGIHDVLTAGDPDSLGRLIEARSSEVAVRVEELSVDARARLSGIDEPMRSVVTSSPAEVEAIYHGLAELRTLFESDVVSLLDITLGFSDTDGDTG